MFHNSALPRGAAGKDTSVPLSCTRIPGFVLQDCLCSVYAAGGFCARRRQLCVVNVKLTMRFRMRAGLLWSAHSISRGFLQARRDGYTGGVKQIWSSRGEGWGCHPEPSRERSAQTKEVFLRALLLRLIFF